MNNLAITPYIGMHALQIQNVKRDVVKKASINELNAEIHTTEKVNDEKELNTNGSIVENINNNINNNNNNNVNNTVKQGTDISNLPEPAAIDNDKFGSQLD